MEGPAWEDFPGGLRVELDSYLIGLARIRRGANGKRIRPCKASTVKTRRAELVAAARMAVREGIPITSLVSLEALLEPAVVEKVLEAYWKGDGSEPRTYTIDLGWKLHSIAREIDCFDTGAMQRLDEIRADLETYRRKGLTEKNLKVIREILSGKVWPDVVNLPKALMQQARLLKGHAPVKAAVTAQLAVAITILTFAPVRLENLVRNPARRELDQTWRSGVSLYTRVPRL